MAVDALPFYEAEAKKRQRRSGGAVPQKIAEPEAGEACEKVACSFGVNRTYGSDSKAIAKVEMTVTNNHDK